MHTFFSPPVLLPLAGYRAPSTAGVNSDNPFLEIGQEEGVLKLLKECLFFPEKIQLRATVEGVLLPPLFVHTMLETQGEALDPALLYHKDRVEPTPLFNNGKFKALKLVYTGQGNYQIDQEHIFFQGMETKKFSLVFQEENCLYTKPFAWETQRSITERVTQMDYGLLFVTPPGKLGVRAFRPYGGYFYPHLPADKAKQVYYELSERDKKTIVCLTLDLPDNAVILSPPKPEEALSLTEALVAGYGKIFLQVGILKRAYKSISCHHSGGNPFFLDVNFVPCV